MKQMNPCCGIKHKSAILAIAIYDIVYGLMFESSGIPFYVMIGQHGHMATKKNETSPLLQNYRKDPLEMINMLIRPAISLLFGIILFFSAKYHLKKYGIVSIFGCTFWIIAQLGLLSITIIRFSRFISDKDDRYMVKKSGATVLETFVILGSVVPFMSIVLAVYEIITVSLFIVKLKQDGSIIKSTEKSLLVAQTNFDTNTSIQLSKLVNDHVDKVVDDSNSKSIGKGSTGKRSPKRSKVGRKLSPGKLNKKLHDVNKKDADPLFQVEVVKDSKQKLKHHPV